MAVFDSKESSAASAESQLVLPPKVKYGTITLSIFSILLPNVWYYAAATYATGIAAGGMPVFVYGSLGVGLILTLLCVNFAEFGSAFPSTAGCTHIATKLGGPRWGRVAGFYTGGFHTIGVLATSPALLVAKAQYLATAINALHPEWVVKRWQIFLIYMFWNFFYLGFTAGGARHLEKVSTVGGFLTFAGLFVTIGLILGYTTADQPASFVWSEFQNYTGWNDGICALLGISASFYAFGPVHWLLNMAEEVKEPRRAIPIAFIWQQLGNTLTLFAFYVAGGYAVVNWLDVVASPYPAPIGTLLDQALGSSKATAALLICLIMIGLLSTMTYISANIRLAYGFARTGALPFQTWLCKLDRREETPLNILYLQTGVNIVMGLVYLGSVKGFWIILGAAFVSYAMGYIPIFVVYLATGGAHMTKDGWFRLPKTISLWLAAVNLVFLLLQLIVYVLPPVYPVTVENMNYSCVFAVAIPTFLTVWWFAAAHRDYKGYEVPIGLDGHVPVERVEEHAKTGLDGLRKE